MKEKKARKEKNIDKISRPRKKKEKTEKIKS